MAFPSSTAQQIVELLQTNHQLHVSIQWVSHFLSSQRSTPPLASLLATAKIRILNSNITNTLDPPPANLLPLTVHNGTLPEFRIPGPIVAQVLTMEDLARSKWEQIEALEALERGEGTVGREVIRVVQETSDGGVVEDKTKGGIWKLLIEDASGRKVWAVELVSITGVGRDMSIGCKLLLRNIICARGVLLMDPSTVAILGGKIEDAHKKWTETRKQELLAAIQRSPS